MQNRDADVLLFIIVITKTNREDSVQLNYNPFINGNHTLINSKHTHFQTWAWRLKR